MLILSPRLSAMPWKLQRKSTFYTNIYRPQTKFAKVMFLHVSVHGGGGGVSASVHSGADPPCAVHAGRYGQQAGGMHPTGMQSCSTSFVLHWGMITIGLRQLRVVTKHRTKNPFESDDNLDIDTNDTNNMHVPGS